jgi:cytochrome c553
MPGNDSGIFGYNRARRNIPAITKKTIDMRLQKYFVAAAALTFFAATSGLCAESGDPAAGKQKNAMCAGCHGIPDYRTAFPEVYSVPKLGGQHAAYIVKALQEYKTGARSHPSMRAVAAGLTDQDMADLAAYFSSSTAKSASK